MNNYKQEIKNWIQNIYRNNMTQYRTILIEIGSEIYEEHIIHHIDGWCDCQEIIYRLDIINNIIKTINEILNG